MAMATTADKEELLKRLKSVEGHIRGVERMVEEGAYCIDITQQIQAVQSALMKVNVLILERHLQACVTSALQNDDTAEREKVIGELVDVFKAIGKA
jgi:CsoR family transcriptional regulator, copper-sensing transcriptional repressor